MDNIENKNIDIQQDSLKQETTLEENFQKEQELIDSITNEQLKEVAQKEFDEMKSDYDTLKNSIGENTISLLSDLKAEFQSDIEGLEKIDTLEYLKNFDNYDLFIDLISLPLKEGGIDETKKEQILDIFKNTDETEIEMHLDTELGGSNLMDEESINFFIETFGSEKNEEIIKKIDPDNISIEEVKKLKIENKENITEDKENITENKEKANETVDKLLGYNGITKDEIDSFKNSDDLIKFFEIKEGKSDKLEKFLNAIKEYDNNNGTELYKDFTSVLITIDSSFETVIKNYEKTKDKEESISGGGEKIEKLSNTIKTGNYSLGLDIGFPIKNIERPITNMTPKERADFTTQKMANLAEQKGLKEEINTLKSKVNYLKDRNKQIDLEIEQLKKWPTVENQEQIKVLKQEKDKNEFIIKDIEPKIDTRLALLEAKQNALKESEKEFNDEMNKRHQEKIKLHLEAKEKAKDNSAFLERIGFTVFSDATINPVVAYINKYPDSLGLKGEIDLVKGEFGESGMDGIDKGREVFVKLFNKMISGSPDEPITDIAGVVKGTNNILREREDAMQMLANYNIDPNRTGIAYKLIDNLKTNSDTKKENVEVSTEEQKEIEITPSKETENNETVSDFTKNKEFSKETNEYFKEVEEKLFNYFNKNKTLDIYYDRVEPELKKLKTDFENGKTTEVERKIKEINNSIK